MKTEKDLANTAFMQYSGLSEEEKEKILKKIKDNQSKLLIPTEKTNPERVLYLQNAITEFLKLIEPSGVE